jgi:hypothetical protein
VNQHVLKLKLPTLFQDRYTISNFNKHGVCVCVCVCVEGGGGTWAASVGGLMYSSLPYGKSKLTVQFLWKSCLPLILNFSKICQVVYRIRGNSKSRVKLDLIMAQIRNWPEIFNVIF